MTSEEKVSLTTGKGCWQTAFVERLNVASVTVSDGPVGLRKENGRETVPSVCFPSVAKLACSFDTALVQKVGAAIGETVPSRRSERFACSRAEYKARPALRT